MATEDDPHICALCKRGRLFSSLKELKVRQGSDKGYLHVQATVEIRICDFCGDKSFGPGADKILDEAFRRKYDNLP